MSKNKYMYLKLTFCLVVVAIGVAIAYKNTGLEATTLNPYVSIDNKSLIIPVRVNKEIYSDEFDDVAKIQLEKLKDNELAKNKNIEVWFSDEYSSQTNNLGIVKFYIENGKIKDTYIQDNKADWKNRPTKEEFDLFNQLVMYKNELSNEENFDKEKNEHFFDYASTNFNKDKSELSRIVDKCISWQNLGMKS